MYVLTSGAVEVQALSRIAKDTGTSEPMDVADLMLHEESAIALDNQYVYVLTRQGVRPIPIASGDVGRMLSLFVPYTVSRDYVAGVESGTSSLTVITKADGRATQIQKHELGFDTMQLKIHRDHLYYAAFAGINDDTSTSLWRIPLAGGTAERFTSVRSSTAALPFAVSDRGLFWAQGQHLLRMVLELEAGPAQGAAGGPCYGDMSCDAELTCVNFACE